MSIEDKTFLSIMDKEMCKDIDGRWMAPLPFKQDRDGKSLIVGDTSIRLMDSTPVLVLCVLNQINLA
jgi:hypothetical protein